MKLLVIGQTPPPFYGQSINIQKMLTLLEKESITLHFVRMGFSDATSEIGSINGKKIFRLITLFLKICKELLFFRPDFIYYPPSGPKKAPIIRDMILLFPVRFFSFPVIFHYHAGGLAEAESMFTGLLKKWFRFTYYRAAYSICLSESGKQDPIALQSLKVCVIPTGVDDYGKRDAGGPIRNILFAGICKESKGIGDFITVIGLLKQQYPDLKGTVIGNIFSPKEGAMIHEAEQAGWISYKGRVTGEEKNTVFREADLLLFPSFFESENFPTVILEAFSFGIPVVSTHWRGIPDLVQDGYNGFIHEVHDINGMVASVEKLLQNPLLYNQYALNARNDFETKYNLPLFEASMAEFFSSLKKN